MLAAAGTPRGFAYGLGAYTIWGLFPAFFGLLGFAAPVEILAHRAIWTLLLMVAVLALGRQLGSLRGSSFRTWLLVAAAAALISTNWGIYIYAVLSGHVTEAALGYFINPLVSVAIGVIAFGERLAFAQVAAIVVAVGAVAVVTVAYGRLPLIALGLAGSFALYGVVKKIVPLPPRTSLTAEAIVLAPPAVAYLTLLGINGHGQLAGSTTHFLLLAACGPMTALPLLLFGAAAHQLPMVTVGLLQYLTPILQMAWAVIVGHERLTATTWAGFALIWCALFVFALHSLRQFGRRPRDHPQSQG
ncbi:EamA family transporter RarD [Mycolicibacterium helvum]|uniref:Putative RarD protein n=1 Tax=Mycolicibacterium helvum TaxID=1534349 RepID=A0A7I7T989_9MYCO|nr:EamA family transporter RarD [Mycolicibacterium helvum]BBY65550.1 putative RarD protein [Mycolicibacterium helvum]